jgi:hypothetical protein
VRSRIAAALAGRISADNRARAAQNLLSTAGSGDAWVGLPSASNRPA